MIREPAPDENERWENWNSTINYVKSCLSKACDLEGKARDKMLRDAKNALNGVPDAHPEKAGLMETVNQML